MTRAEIIAGLTDDPDFPVSAAARAELAKDCAGCKWFVGARGEVRWASCAARGGMHSIPVDGSGFCHRWEAK